jgi:cell division protease FtsH
MALGGRAAEELVFHEPTTGAVSDIEKATKVARAMVTELGMSSKLGAVKYGTEHGDPFLGRTMGNQPDYSHEVAREIDEEVRKLIETAHTEAWEILTEYRDVLDIVAGELLEKETLHRAELEAIFADVEKRPRLTLFDDFGGRIPSDKPPIKTPGELAIERGEPWPKPSPEPAFKAAIAAAARDAAQAEADRATNGANGSHDVPGAPVGAPGSAPQHSTQPDYGAPAGWHAPGWPPPQQPPGYWYPPPSPPPPPAHWPQPPHNYAGPHAQPYPPYPPYPPPGAPAPEAGTAADPTAPPGSDPSPSNPSAHG